MEVKKEKMEAKKGEGKGRRQKAVIGIFVAAVVIAALFTVTIGIGMNNSDTGNGVVGKSDLGDAITAYGNDGEATSSNDVRINGILAAGPQGGQIDFTDFSRGESRTIYEGTSGFLITITCIDGTLDVEYYVDGNKKGDTRSLYGNIIGGQEQSITLSHGFGKGELKRIDVERREAPGTGYYEIA